MSSRVACCWRLRALTKRRKAARFASSGPEAIVSSNRPRKSQSSLVSPWTSASLTSTVASSPRRTSSRAFSRWSCFSLRSTSSLLVEVMLSRRLGVIRLICNAPQKLDRWIR